MLYCMMFSMFDFQSQGPPASGVNLRLKVYGNQSTLYTKDLLKEKEGEGGGMRRKEERGGDF